MKKAVILLLIFVLALISSCTEVKVVDLNITSKDTINTTKIDKNESMYAEEGLKELPEELKEGLCTEKVLLALRKCRWAADDPNNLRITIKNNGFKNVTMAFYLFDNQGQIGSVFNDTLFTEKEEWTYALPFNELEEQYGEIRKIHATPILTEENETISCSNKKLPVLVRGCN